MDLACCGNDRRRKTMRNDGEENEEKQFHGISYRKRLMLSRSTGSKGPSLLEVVQQREMSKKEMLEKENPKKKTEGRDNRYQSLPYLAEDFVASILILLPIDALWRLSYVCKPWRDIIKNSLFIQSHLCRSESCLVFQTTVEEDLKVFHFPLPEIEQKIFSVEHKLQKSKYFSNLCGPRKHIHFSEFKDGKMKIRDYKISCRGDILASCNGLILLGYKEGLKKGSLVLLNPVTRKLDTLPMGTICRDYEESTGLVFDSFIKAYKVVHLFKDSADLVCEILVVGKREWMVVDGPGYGLIRTFGQKPVSAIGGIHWLPEVYHYDYVVSMDIATSKFKTVSLPKLGKANDGIIELADDLCFVAHEGITTICIWVLKSLSEENWVKKHTVHLDSLVRLVPVCGSRLGRHLIFMSHKKPSLYLYDIDDQLLRKMKTEVGPNWPRFFAHVNSLVSWSN